MIRRTCRRSPSGCWIRPPTRASRSARCTPAWTRCPSRRCPGEWPFVRGGDALRDVKSGWKVAEAFPVAGQKAVADGNGAVLVALTEGVSALVLRVGAPDGVRAGRAGPAARGCLPRPRAGRPRRRCGLRRRRRGGAAAADRSGRRPARAAVDGSRRRPADRTAERAAGADIADVVATAAKVTELRRRRASDHRRRPRIPQPRRQRVLGAGRQRRRRRSPTCGCSATAASSVPDALRQISFRFAADDDQFMTIAKLRAARQLWARVAEVVGEPDAGAARCTRSRRCR